MGDWWAQSDKSYISREEEVQEQTKKQQIKDTELAKKRQHERASEKKRELAKKDKVIAKGDGKELAKKHKKQEKRARKEKKVANKIQRATKKLAKEIKCQQNKSYHVVGRYVTLPSKISQLIIIDSYIKSLINDFPFINYGDTRSFMPKYIELICSIIYLTLFGSNTVS